MCMFRADTTYPAYSLETTNVLMTAFQAPFCKCFMLNGILQLSERRVAQRKQNLEFLRASHLHANVQICYRTLRFVLLPLVALLQT